MNTESKNKTGRKPARIARAWERRVTANQRRRRAVRAASPRRPGENRLVSSLHDLWRLLWGTHESSAK